MKDITCSSALDKTVSKAVIALARLSQDSSTADMVIKLGGLRELVNLLKVVPAQETEIPMAIMVAIKSKLISWEIRTVLLLYFNLD